MKFKQYDAVRLKRIIAPIAQMDDECNLRLPKIGDIAYIVEVYSNPAGYELECSDANGITQWLMSFSPDDVELSIADCCRPEADGYRRNGSYQRCIDETRQKMVNRYTNLMGK